MLKDVKYHAMAKLAPVWIACVLGTAVTGNTTYLVVDLGGVMYTY